MFRTIATTICLALAATAAFAQQSPTPSPDDARRREEDIARGRAAFILLIEPSRCGSEAPRGYACAVILYRDTRGEDASRDRIPESIVVRVAKITGAGGLPRDAKVEVLSPFDSCRREFSPFELNRLRMSLTSNQHGAEIAVLEMKGLLGYAENEALPAGDPRKTDRRLFRLPQCTFGR
jgi:hypothetical protein